MGNTTSGGAQDGAQVLARFRAANDAYEAATDAERSNLFVRRHAALMLVLGAHPSSHDEVCDIIAYGAPRAGKRFTPGRAGATACKPSKSLARLLFIEETLPSSCARMTRFRQSPSSISIRASRSWTALPFCLPTSPTILAERKPRPCFSRC